MRAVSFDKSSKTGPSASEAALIALSRNGDTGAFSELIKKYENRIWGILHSVCAGAPSETEDAFQETFLSAFRNLKKFRSSSNLGTWLYRIAANQCFMRLRKKKRERTESLDAGMAGDNGRRFCRELSDWSGIPDRMADRKEVSEVVQKAMDSLPSDYRVVLSMRDMEGISNEETAGILKMSVPAVKSRLHRGRKLLRDSLNEFFTNGEKK